MNSSNEELEEVYANIGKIIKNVKEEENLVEMGDYNAIVEELNVKNLTCAYGLGRRNERENFLLEFCANIT